MCFIMSQSAAATTTTQPVIVVCCSISSLTMTITMTPTLMGLPVTLGQYDLVLPPLLTLGETGGIVCLTTVL